jgi:arylsulfatase A-like enzyme
MASPNIVFILIDDMGQRDIGCYGSTFYETPNIDRLAREGMLFTDAYAACPVCSPTRGSILTGRYPASLGITDWIDWGGSLHPARGRLVDVPYIKNLPADVPNLATELARRGYAAWHVGKWHLGGEEAWPDRRGFHVNVGGWTAGMPYKGYFSPWEFPTLEDGPEGEYLTDRLTDEAIALLRGRDADRPFYLNMWYYSVHTPIQAKEVTIEKYRRKAAFLGLDTIEPHVVGDAYPCEHKKDKRISRRIVQSDPVYAAMIESLDLNIGRLLAVLEEEGVADDTIVVFTSDNGGLSTAEGAPTCNLPLAEGKGWMYEGGTREPLLVRWPAVVDAGSTSSAVVTSPDFLPTLLAAADAGSGADAELPPGVEGESFLPVLNGSGGSLVRDAVFWHYPHYGNQGGTPGSSVRSGRYKLIEFFETGRLELFDLEADVGENYDLADELPAVRDRLHALLVEWRASVEAKIPQPNADYAPWPRRAPESRHAGRTRGHLTAGIEFE